MSRSCPSENTVVATVFAIILAVVIGLSWLTCAAQQSAYERMGVHLTKWEILCGVKPVVVAKP